MQLKNNYYYFNSVISSENCQKIIDLGLSKIKNLKNEGHNTSGFTAGNTQKGVKPNTVPLGEKTLQSIKKEGLKEEDVYVRDSDICWLTDKWLYDLIHPYIHEANKKAGWNFQWDYSESFQFTTYNPGGFYSFHKDGSSDHFGKLKRYIYGITEENEPLNNIIPDGYTINDNMVGKVRKLSLTLNLNKPGEYEGGNLMFDFGNHTTSERFHQCTEIRPQGSIIVFPSFLDHCVTPITSGTRYSLVLWSLGEPFK
jgi:PKHD-type hydroxylase